MNIREALRPTGKAMYPGQTDAYVELRFDNGANYLVWVNTKGNEEGGRVAYEMHFKDDWQPYYEEKEIRPEKAGELWEHHGVIFMFVVDATVSYMKSSLPNKIGTVSKEGWQLKAIHGKNGWTRLYPPVEDDSVERIEVEDCILYETQYQPPEYKFVNYTFRMDDERLDGISKAKFIIEIPKEKP